jgi:hypothetical protein
LLGPSLETVRQTIAINNPISPRGAEDFAERLGSYRGETVRTSAQNSQISPAAKDVSVLSKLKTNLATLAQRSFRQGQATTMLATK